MNLGSDGGGGGADTSLSDQACTASSRHRKEGLQSIQERASREAAEACPGSIIPLKAACFSQPRRRCHSKCEEEACVCMRFACDESEGRERRKGR